MGGGTGSEFLANSRTSPVLCHAHFGHSLGAVSERHDLPNAHSAYCGCDPAREITPAPVSSCARDQRKHRQRGHTGGQSAKHDRRTFLAHFLSGIFTRAASGGPYWPGDQFSDFAFWFSKNAMEESNYSCQTGDSKTRARSVRACLRCVRVNLCRFSCRSELGVDSGGRCGVANGTRAARHARSALARRLAFASFFRGTLHRSRWLERYRPAKCHLLAAAADFWIKYVGASVEPGLVFGARIERFL